MYMSKIDDVLRNEWAKVIADFLTEKGEEVLYEKDNMLWIPTTNSDGDDKWIRINVQVPTKVDDDDDGYAKQEQFFAKKAEKEAKTKEAAEKKAKKTAADAAKRAAKKAKTEEGE